jgi:hypothetical protein
LHTDTTTIPDLAPDLSAATCSCARPLPQEQAERKGASRTTCARCGLPIRLRLGAA